MKRRAVRGSTYVCRFKYVQRVLPWPVRVWGSWKVRV